MLAEITSHLLKGKYSYCVVRVYVFLADDNFSTTLNAIFQLSILC